MSGDGQVLREGLTKQIDLNYSYMELATVQSVAPEMLTAACEPQELLSNASSQGPSQTDSDLIKICMLARLQAPFAHEVQGSWQHHPRNLSGRKEAPI